jgi:hypothetical protein
MPKFLAPLVGMHFRPPAKALLSVLPQGHPLYLRREPHNEYDPHAVAVDLLTATLPERLHEDLAQMLPPMGHTLEDFLSQERWHLGYLANKAKTGGEFATQVSPLLERIEARVIAGELEGEAAVALIAASLVYDERGLPRVAWEYNDA